MTRNDALSLAYGQLIYHTTRRNADGTALRARVTGKPQIWKRTDRWEVPVKHGLRTSFRLTESNISQWTLEEPKYEPQRRVRPTHPV